MNKSFIISNNILHILVTVTFLALFFFLYMIKIQQNKVRDQLRNIISELTCGSEVFLPDFTREKMIQFLNMIDIDRDYKRDKEIKDKNRKIIFQSLTFFIGLNMLGGLIIACLWYNQHFDITKLIVYNLTLFFLMFILYILFYTLIVRNYNIVDSNYVKYIFFQNLKNYINEK